MSSENVDERKEQEGKSVFSQMEEKKWDEAQIKIRQWMKTRTDPFFPPFRSANKQQHEINSDLFTFFIILI